MNSIAFVSYHHIITRNGGAELQSDILAKAMVEIGWDVSYITYSIDKPQQFNGYRLIPAPKTANELWQCLSRVNADIYYQRGRSELTYLVGKFCKKSGKRFVFSTSMDIDCYKHKYSFRNGFFKGVLLYSKTNRVDKLSLWGIKSAFRVLAQTNFQQKLIKENLGISSTVFCNVHHIPDDKIYRNHSPVRILWLANLKDWKQPEIFLRLVRDMRETDCKFIMAGALISKRYKCLIESTKVVNKNFEYLGSVSPKEGNALIANSDIFVNTSKPQEGFPNTFIQAWLRGVPTVSLTVDPDGLISERKLGIVAGNNFVTLKDAITFLVNNPTIRKETGDYAKEISMDFSIERNIEKFKTIIIG
jgi:glycosyltransferase involved in cell wall biosynthesis